MSGNFDPQAHALFVGTDPHGVSPAGKYVQIDNDEEVRKRFRIELARAVSPARKAIDGLPNSRAKSLALTKLDEAELWAERAIKETVTAFHA